MKKLYLVIVLVLVAVMAFGCAAPAAAPSAAPAAESAAAPAASAAAPAESAAAPAESAAAPAESAAAPAAGESIKVGFALKTQDSPYFVALAETFKELAAARGWEAVLLDANGDTEKEAQNMDALVSQGCKVIFLNSVDPESCIPSIDKADAAGVGVINVDSACGQPANDICTVYSNNPQNGRAVGLAYAKKMMDTDINAILLSGAKGNVAGKERRMGLFAGIIEGKTGVSEEEAWKLSQEMEDQLVASGKAENKDAGFAISGQGWGAWTIEDGLVASEDLITANSGLNCVLGENDQMLFGAQKALENAGITGVDIVAAADGAKDAYAQIKEGKYFGTGENNPVKVMTRAYEIIDEVVAAGFDPAQMHSYEKIITTDPNAVTAENVDQFYDPNSIF